MRHSFALSRLPVWHLADLESLTRGRLYARVLSAFRSLWSRCRANDTAAVSFFGRLPSISLGGESLPLAPYRVPTLHGVAVMPYRLLDVMGATEPAISEVLAICVFGKQGERYGIQWY